MASDDKTFVSDPLIGATLGEYRVVELMARGGMAIVYRGEQPDIGKTVAIKVLLPEYAEDPVMVQRLLEEARSVSALRHPNLINVYGFGQLPDGRHYYVMEYLVGLSLAELLARDGRLRLGDAVEMLVQMCDGLTAAHQAGVIHRDLKPGNIFVCELPDGSRRVKLLDFGIAKRTDSSLRTAANVVLGTPSFMAPEQVRGKPVGPQTDLYALGIIAHCMLAGSEPFKGESAIELMQKHLVETPVPLRARGAEVPAELEELISALLEKEMSARPASAADVKARLQRFVVALSRSQTVEDRLSVATPLPTRTVVVERDTARTVPAPSSKPRAPLTFVWVLLGLGVGIGGTVLVMRSLQQPQVVQPPPVVAQPVAPPPAPTPVAPEPVPPPAPVAVPVPVPVPVPPRPPSRPQKSRDDVRSELGALRTRAKSLPAGAVRQLVEQELGKLRARLDAGERPAQISSEAEQLAREAGLR